ncbi:MAG: ABC transporter permease [Bacteroidales bacterium]|nr:ABC transporter permease [Bacteroidales bacterium]
MYRLLASIKKEWLILVRDWAGLGLIFMMPIVLVLVMTLIQDASFRKLDETKITLLYLDEDHDTLGIQVKNGLVKAEYFEVITSLEDRELDEKAVLGQVAQGNYQIGIVIRKGSTDAIRTRGQQMVQQTIFGLDAGTVADTTVKARIIIYYDPAMKNSFRLTVRNALENFTSKIEAGIMFQALSAELAQYLPEPPAPMSGAGSSISYEEIYATDAYSEIIPNSVQHNVPAWTIFAMFFIIIPLTGNLIKERESGLATRLLVMPGNQLQALGAKVTVYVMVGLVQFILMLILGKLVLPLFDLPSLVLGPQKLALFLMALATTLAATGYSVLVGTVARTHDQAAVFGMVSVIILAAIGGIWVPVFMMPNLMQAVSIISPLNWSLDGFYQILLRGGGVREIGANLAALIAFFAINLTAAIWVSGRRVRL